MTLYYPYPHQIRATLELQLEGVQAEEDASNCTIDLRRREGFLPISELTATVRMTNVQNPADLEAVVVVARCSKTNLRQAQVLEPIDRSRLAWSGNLSIDTRSLRGNTEVVGIVAGNVDGNRDRRLAETDPWTLIVDEESDPAVHGEFKVQWTAFDGHDRFDAISDQPFYLDLGEPSSPVLHLNSSIEGFQRIMPSTGQPERPLNALFELSRTGIVLPVWIALFQTALSGVQGSEVEGHSWPPVPWQERLLKSLLPRVYGQLSEDELLERAVGLSTRDADTEASMAELMQGLLAVLQKDLVRSGRGLRTAIQTIQRLGEEEL